MSERLILDDAERAVLRALDQLWSEQRQPTPDAVIACAAGTSHQTAERLAEGLDGLVAKGLASHEAGGWRLTRTGLICQRMNACWPAAGD